MNKILRFSFVKGTSIPTKSWKFLCHGVLRDDHCWNLDDFWLLKAEIFWEYDGSNAVLFNVSSAAEFVTQFVAC